MKLNLKDDTSARNWIYGRGGDLWSWLALLLSLFHLHLLGVFLSLGDALELVVGGTALVTRFRFRDTGAV